jgi:anti-sigma B factor antagonist
LGDGSDKGAGDAGAAGLLEVRQEQGEDGILTIWLEGELDLATASRVREPIEAAIEAGTRRIVVDMLACTFIDSTGLGVLLHGAKRLGGTGGAMAVVCVDDQIKRLLELTMIDRTIPVFETREQALADVSAGASEEPVDRPAE